MTVIAESDGPDAGSAVLQTWRLLLDGVSGQLRELGAHPARTVVLLPYAQLMPLAARLWAEQFPNGLPRASRPPATGRHGWARSSRGRTI